MVCRLPPRAKGVQIGTTDAAVGDLDIHVFFTPLLRLVGFSLHVTISGLTVMAQPAFEFVVGAHCFGQSFFFCKTGLILSGESRDFNVQMSTKVDEGRLGMERDGHQSNLGLPCFTQEHQRNQCPHICPQLTSRSLSNS